jgi:ubiquinone/menaquinone biosynthesis C-methylase UbiE
MATNDAAFAGSIPELYDRLMVPLIFDSYARDMALRVAAVRPRRILETATGTGAVTRAMTAAMPDAAFVATDLNQAMLDRAQAQHPDAQRVRWQQADALALPFEDASFDTVVCQFGAMFFPDRVKGYGEARRVLKDGGAFLFSVWDRIEDNEPTS